MPSLLEQLLNKLPELVMYDLDGTLVDSVPGMALAVDRALADLDVAPAGEARVRTWVGGGQRLLLEQALDFAGLSQAQFELGLSRFRHHYRETANHRLRLFPGVAQLLTFLHDHGVKQTIITNKPIEYVPDMLKTLAIDGFFVDCLGGECLAERKPSALPLTTMLARLGVAAEASLMVGDSSNDLIAAQNAGVASVAVTYGYHRGVDLSQYAPVWLGEDLADLSQPI